MRAVDQDRVEAEVQRLGRLIVAGAKEETSIHPIDWFDARVMEWAMGDEKLKVELFRFIDVLPALRTAEEVARHLERYFASPGSEVPAAWSFHLASHNPIAAHAAAAVVRTNAERMAHRFIAGDHLPAVIETVRRLRRKRMGFTVDLLGEATVSEAKAATYQSRYLEALESLSKEAATWAADPVLDKAGGRAAPRVNVSVKLSSLYSQIDPAAPVESSRAVRERLRPILLSAMKHGAAVIIDMEQYALKTLTLQIFRDILDEPAFRYWDQCGIAMQAYLTETEQDVRELINWAQSRPVAVSVRLVRGAYWDYETVMAAQRGWPVPVFTQKASTDASYERCLRLLMEAYPAITTAAGTHNIRSLALTMALARELDLPEGAAEMQMLYGMADSIKQQVVDMGWRLRVYAPFGELLPGMAYLVRRLLENTSSESFLRMRFHEDVPLDQLLSPPVQKAEAGSAAPAGSAAQAGSVRADGRPLDFANEPDRDFSQSNQRELMAAAMERVRGRLGQDYPLVIAGADVWTDSCIVSRNPSRPGEVIGRMSSATAADANHALTAAIEAFPRWREAGWRHRAEVLQKAAAIMRSARDELAAWEIFETGKNWREADADVTESIDYLEYYSRQALRLGRPLPMSSIPGESNQAWYEPRGVVVVIPPWNFPLAILTGMTSAALVTGNTVVLKPASQSPVIGALFNRIFQQAGIPAGVLNFLPGPGAEIGDLLVDDPRVAMIAFTGSRSVGQRLLLRAAEVRPGQRHLKHVIAELGGKNAIIVDSDADLDDAVTGVVASAFGYQGQKCSACSRVICVGDVYEPFMTRLTAAAGSLRIGPADDPANFMGPVIEENARDRIRKAIESGKSHAQVAMEADTSGLQDGYFVGPVIFRDIDPDSELARSEIFGPVLSAIPARNLTEALEIANGVNYALTGGIYSRSPANVERARREFFVGNLYINRKITGALVGRQPFGGFKLSGTDSKAGGPDYLQQFVLGRTITENTLRRGFAPVPTKLSPVPSYSDPRP